jgi:hypothetical protein
VRKPAMKSDVMNKVTYKNKKLKTGRKCQRCGWWIESGEMATRWNNINIYTHIKCENPKIT